jgi:ligand-binding SRPBCC domain-containing protein
MLQQLIRHQFIKSDIETIWSFISSPKNLAQITPPHMGFNILNQANAIEKMYAGQLIQYHVSPLLNIKLYWVTEITHVSQNNYFVDEQRFGPYKFWHHQHFLKQVNGGVEMTDIVHYKAPFGPIGTIANNLFIKKQLKQIFDYRYQKIEELFNK